MANYKLFSNSDKVTDNQAKYGPTADLDESQRRELLSHYVSDGRGETQQSPLNRLSQYSATHATYVKAANQTKRPLSEQEKVAERTGNNAPNSSINHIIASGTGQNILNHETLRFKQGARNTEEGQAALAAMTSSTPKELAENQRKVLKGLAQQAASVGRTQGYSRAILNERQGESGFDTLRARRGAMQDTLTAFQGPVSTLASTPEERFAAYKRVLKSTFDSPGNLRVGNNTANTKISTGIDLPLDRNGRPTDRATRLLQAHEAFAPDRLLDEKRMFTRNQRGDRLSSSMQSDSTTASVATQAASSNKRKARPAALSQASAKKTRSDRLSSSRQSDPTTASGATQAASSNKRKAGPAALSQASAKKTRKK